MTPCTYTDNDDMPENLRLQVSRKTCEIFIFLGIYFWHPDHYLTKNKTSFLLNRFLALFRGVSMVTRQTLLVSVAPNTSILLSRFAFRPFDPSSC